MNIFKFLVSLAMLLFLNACDSGPNSPKGFSLPEGNVAKGQEALLKHQCLSCHELEGMERKSMPAELDKLVKLGGQSSKVTTYAELVTSIINPSHRIDYKNKFNSTDNSGQSKMRIYNDVMTVSELIDIVAFLQPKYKVKPYKYTSYELYYMP